MLRASAKGVAGDELSLKVKGEPKVIGFDRIIAAKRTVSPAWEALKGPGKEIHFIGDAKKPRRLLNAIHDGYRLGMEL